MTDAGYDSLLATLYDDRESVAARTEDVAFYRDLARDADGPALELACGTGRVYLDVLAAGVDVDGLDASAPALTELRERAAERGLEPDVWTDDIREFAVDREYGLVYCPFNALQHVTSLDGLRSTFARAHEALAPGGTFAFDVFVPSLAVMREEYGEWRTERLTHEGSEHVLRQRPRLVDEVEQTVRVEVELRTTDGDPVDETAFEVGLLPPQQLELLARDSPFADWSAAGGFDGEPLEHGASTQVWTLEKQR